jgi:hypothetical protein
LGFRAIFFQKFLAIASCTIGLFFAKQNSFLSYLSYGCQTTGTTAVLILEDGTSVHGKAFGKIGTATGEICFNTGMTGYQEVFTDPSYYGQVLIMNNVHIGNYGVKPSDVESDSV